MLQNYILIDILGISFIMYHCTVVVRKLYISCNNACETIGTLNFKIVSFIPVKYSTVMFKTDYSF